MVPSLGHINPVFALETGFLAGCQKLGFQGRNRVDQRVYASQYFF